MAVTVSSQAQLRDYLPEVAKAVITLQEEINAGGGTVPSFAAPVSIGTANAAGAASTLVRSDHVHNHGAQTEPTHHAVATALANGFMPSTDKAKLDSLQAGTDTLVNGTVTISTATITASSRILITMKDPGAGAITDFASFEVPVASRVVGAPGAFTVNAIDSAKVLIATAACTFDWLVIG